MTKVAKYTVVVLLTLSLLIILWQFNIAIVIFLLSLGTAAAFRPGIEFFMKRNLHPSLSLVLTYFLAIVIIAGLIIVISTPFLQDLQQITDDFTQSYERIKTFWPLGGSAYQKTIAEQLPEPSKLYDTLASEEGLDLAQSFLGVAIDFFDILGKIVIVLILSMYWSADRVRFERLWLSLIPVDKRINARDIWRSIESGVGAYLRSEVVQSILAIILLWLGYWAIGLDYPTVLALSGAILMLIPWLGALLAMIAPLIVGLGIHTGLGILAAFYTALVIIVLEFMVEPLFFPRQKFSSLLIALLLIALALAFGLIGVIFAPPLAAMIQISFNRLVLNRYSGDGVPATSEVEALNERLSGVREMITHTDEPPPAQMWSLVERLDKLLRRTKHYLETNELPSSKSIED